MRKITAFAVLMSLSVHVSLFSQSQVKDELTKQTVYIKVEDSIRLATDIYFPEGEGPFACILVRLPYNMNGIGQSGENYIRTFLENGWVTVLQDTRGKFESNGAYHPFMHERTDGLATVRWIRSQAWSNGKIAGWGGSYVGYTQWAVADQLDVITPTVTSANMYELVYPNGIYSLATALNWGLSNGARTYNAIDPQKLEQSYFTLPLSVADDSAVKQIDFMDQWIRHPFEDVYWRTMNHRAVVNCPVLSIAGWYDIFLMAQIRDFEWMESFRHPHSRLIIGPYAHGQITIDTDFGENGDLTAFDDDIVAFIGSHLEEEEGEPVQTGTQAPYSFFIMHKNEWIESDQWPPRHSRATAFYLSTDGSISQNKSAEVQELGFIYDPSDPYPSIGGTYLGVGVGPAYQNPNTQRSDQLVFESEALEESMILLGPMDASIYVSTDVPSTDFFISVQEVRDDGKILNIQEGGTTVYSGDRTDPWLRKVDVSLWATGYQIHAGHKLRVVVSSSLFPRYNRNLNSGEEIFFAHSPRVAHQKLYVGKKYPSHLTLPVYREE